MKRLVIASTILATAALSLPAISSAHAIWFAQRAKQFTALIYGEGPDDLDATQRIPLLKAVYGYDNNYKPVPATIKADGHQAVVESKSPIRAVATWMDYGTWTRAPGQESVKKFKNEVPNATSASQNFKYAVGLVGTLEGNTTLPLLPDIPMQVVPVGAIPLEMGKPLKVKVYFNGKPVPNATVWPDYVNDMGHTKKTGPDGTVTFPLRNQGRNVVVAIYNQKSDAPQKYDQIEQKASLSFTVPHPDD